ncbi:MAG: hypothetical protein WC975_09245 [Phycisphaerae bacterium]
MEFKPDFKAVEPYLKAFWEGEVLDRVAMSVTGPKQRGFTGYNWLHPAVVNQASAEEILDGFESVVRQTFYGGLSVPFFWPNLGPDVFSAFLGADLKFSVDSQDTSWIDWSQPVLKDYSDLSVLAIRDSNPFYRKILNLTHQAAERGQGRYFVGHTDIHAGFDALSVLRGGPQVASIDLVENPSGVQAAMKKLHQAWRKVYDDTYALLTDHQKGTTNWMSIWAPGRMYPVQNDFSCLLSPGMYREFLLEELIAEIEHLDYSIYHLDGVEALQHLDLLLEIPRLNVIQWVSGARHANEGIARWIPLFQKIQAKKKSIVVYPRPEEIPMVLENLKPEGLLIQVWTQDETEAREVLKKCHW